MRVVELLAAFAIATTQRQQTAGRCVLSASRDGTAGWWPLWGGGSGGYIALKGGNPLSMMQMTHLAAYC